MGCASRLCSRTLSFAASCRQRAATSGSASLAPRLNRVALTTAPHSRVTRIAATENQATKKVTAARPNHDVSSAARVATGACVACVESTIECDCVGRDFSAERGSCGSCSGKASWIIGWSSSAEAKRGVGAPDAISPAATDVECCQAGRGIERRGKSRPPSSAAAHGARREATSVIR